LSSTLPSSPSASPRASPLPCRSQYKATNGVCGFCWTRYSSSFSRLVLPSRRAPTAHSESRSPSSTSRSTSVRPKKLSARTQLPAMKGLRTSASLPQLFFDPPPHPPHVGGGSCCCQNGTAFRCSIAPTPALPTQGP